MLHMLHMRHMRHAYTAYTTHTAEAPGALLAAAESKQPNHRHARGDPRSDVRHRDREREPTHLRRTYMYDKVIMQ